MKIRYISGLSFLIFLISAFFSNNILAQGTIAHQTGAYYNDYMPNGKQKTHEYHEIVYVNPSGGTINLDLPSKSATSPHHYFRWYNYTTDTQSPNLVPGGTTYTNGYVQYGGGLLDSRPYTVNSGSLPEVIACDVSAYIDYTLVNNFVTVEPTLSYRSVFEIRDGNEIATDLQSATNSGNYLQESHIYMPATPASNGEKPRVTLNYTPGNYLGYDGTGTLMGGTLAYSGSNVASYNSSFIFINTGAAGTSTQVTVTLRVGNGANQRTYNVAKFDIDFIVDAPQPYASSGYRSLDFMDQNYYLLGKLDFDFDTQPATAANNMWSSPLPYQICEYGFVSEKLFNNQLRGFNNKVSQWNEYGFYKTANVSLPGLTGYQWYNGNRQVYDRLYSESGGTQQGYFMYIDAAQSPGVIAQLPISKLCAGTKLFISAGIASLTSGASDPDLNIVFYGIDSNGKKIELNRYTSGDIPKASSSPTPWYQIYYSFTFTDDVDYVSYLLQVENNCTSTNGGDYAVDDMRIYRSKPAVQTYQLELPCGEEGVKVKVMVEYDKLLASLGQTEQTSGSGQLIPLKYKILDEAYNPVTYNYGTDANPNYNFGEISISTKFDEMPVLADGQDPPIATGDLNIVAYTQTENIEGIENRYIVFLVPNTSTLVNESVYHAVVADADDNFDTGICALISDPFSIIPSSTITVDGSPWIEGDGLCYGNTLSIGVTLRDRTGLHTEISALFDWYFGTLIEYQTPVSGSSYSVMNALEIYRSVYPNPNENDALSTAYQGSYTKEIHDLLQQQIDKGELVINKKSVDRVIRQADVILAIPLVETADVSTGVNISDLCTEIIVINTNGPANNPTIQLGNEYFKNLRMGLAQFDDLKQNSSKTLTIPVSDFINSDGSKSRPLTLGADLSVYLISTNDGNISVNPEDELTFIKVGQIQSINVSNTANDNIVFNIPAGSSFVAREGYTYTFEFHFNEKTGISETPACDGTGRFTIKMVPEYLTWTGKNGDNWNNDDNWQRSVKSELYKTDYTDDSNASGFVPMNFSKATISATNGTSVTKSPWLYKLSGTPFLNMDNTNYTDNADKLANAATDSIEYDLVLKANGESYDCENFYGNTADQVYFKSMAEMRNTNYLIYNKAHVDFELTSGRWYMLASPLKNVVAGDMYLPKLSGRQETEAFKPITYNTTLNNRFDPPVYQRSWDKANSIIFRQDGTNEDAYISTTWSQVYNKVDESYDGGKGFSIKPIFGTKGTDKVMFRLPKDDDTYLYYSYDGQATGNSTSIARTNNGRLVFENNASNVSVSIGNQSGSNNVFLVGNPFMATLDMKKFFDSNPDFERNYWIITAGGLSAVQIGTDGSVTASGNKLMDGTVVPMQSFFVERTDGSNTSSVIFTPDMTLASTDASQNSIKNTENNNLQNPVLRIKASSNGGSSSILIQKTNTAENDYDAREDVQVIMDSNLEDIPTLYTMSGTKAVMINTVSNQDSIPLGIISKDDKEVTLTFEGVDSFQDGIFLYDKQLNKSTTLDRSAPYITIPGNTYGRYYLKLSSASGIISEDSSIVVYSPNEGLVVVKSLSSDELHRIQVYNINGMLIKDLNSINASSAEMTLPSDQVYILKITSSINSFSTKVYCR